MGTIRSRQGGPLSDFQDTGGISSDEDDDDDDDFVDARSEPPSPNPSPTAIGSGYPPISSPAVITVTSPTTPTTENSLKTITTTTSTPGKSGFIPRMKFPRKISGLTASLSPSNSSIPPSDLTSSASGISHALKPSKKCHVRRGTGGSITAFNSSGVSVGHVAEPLSLPSTKKKREIGYQYAGGNDIIGIVMLEVQGAEDLPRLRNSTPSVGQHDTLTNFVQ